MFVLFMFNQMKFDYPKLLLTRNQIGPTTREQLTGCFVALRLFGSFGIEEFAEFF